MLAKRLRSGPRRLVLGLFSLAAIVPSLLAQSSLPITADTRLVVGWDFEFDAGNYSALPTAGVLPANYSDLYPPQTGVNDGSPSAARGTMYLNGTNGSDLWTFSGPTASATKNTSFGDADQQILTRDGSATKLGGFGGLASAALANNRSSGTRSKIAFVINTTGIGSLVGVSYRTRMQADGLTASVDWSLVVGATTDPLGGAVSVTGSIFTTKEFLLNSVSLGGATSVTLVATVDNTSTSNVMLLDNLAVYGTPAGVGTAPVITSSLTATATVGTPFSYTITADNTPTSYNATSLPAWAAVNTTTGVISGTPNVAAVTNISISATNGAGSDTKTLVLTTNAASTAPAITTHPANATKLVGENATFTVAASGNPTPTYQWQRSTDGGTNWSNLANDATFSGTTAVTLTVTSVTAPMNNHRFRAIATNGVAPDATSNGAILTVNVAPSVPTPPANITKVAGENATFTVVFAGQPTPTVKWQRSTDGGTNFIDLTETAPFSGTTTTTLTITSVATTMSAHQFRAVATNGIGSDATSAAAILTVNPGAPVIDSPTTTTGAVGVNFSYTITATNTPTSFGATNLPSWASINTATGAITGIPDAAAVTTVNISATNGTGTGNGQVQITVSATPPSPPVITSATTATGTVGVAVTYTITATNSPTSFGATNLPSWASLNTATGAITGTPNAAAVTTVSISATNAGGTGNGQVQITIVDVPPPSTPTGSSTNYNSFSAQWTAVAGATGYRLDVATDAAFTQFVTGFQDLDVGNVTTKAVPGLPLGKYYFRVRAYNGGGTSMSSSASSVDVGSRLVNLSTRGQTSSASPMIGGFFVSGAAKTVLIRAAAKVLADLGVPGTVPNPRLRLVNQATGLDIATNDDWNAADPVVIDAVTRSGAGLVFTPGSVDSVIVAQNLAPGGYTAIVETVTGVAGIVLMELYEIDETGRLANISTRGVTVDAGANVMIPGTFFGPTSKKLLIRVVGETLGNFLPPATVLTDPVLEIYDQDAPNTPLLTNDDWNAGDAALKATWTAGDPNQVAGLALPPTGSKDSAVLVVLPKNVGGYTVIARGKNGATGNVLVEIYEAR